MMSGSQSNKNRSYENKEVINYTTFPLYIQVCMAGVIQVSPRPLHGYHMVTIVITSLTDNLTLINPIKRAKTSELI